ncbi:MAG: uroporphyrinogen-III C-methyltransferase [Deltaproteobacteria bacterium]|nr:uroporphyrinogen-III C-methyltransferase [Deltaproteobacteria bacterium]
MKQGIVYLIGAGPGDPDLITVRALSVLEAADCIVYDHLANPVLIERYRCEKVYVGKKGSDHTLAQQDINGLLVRKAREGKIVARLKGGDPFVFGRGGEEAEELADAGIAFVIVPGISSFYAAPAYAGIPVTHRDFANALEVVTGHRRADAADAEGVNFPVYDPDKTFAFLMGMKNLAHITATLVREKGFPSETPVAVISWGTRPEQRVITGTLADIAGITREAGLRPPSTIIVGGVVALRGKLRWFDTLPLFGKKIVVTRTRTQASKLTKRLRALGAAVIELPTIEIKPLDDQTALKKALGHIRDFKWLFLTSQNAVTVLFDTLADMGLDTRVFGEIKVAVIGPATGDALARYGIRPEIVPQEFVAEGLLREAAGLELGGCNVLLPCSQEARSTLADGLMELGAQVERVHTYTTVRPVNVSDEQLQAVAKVDIITFTSSSTVRNFFAIQSQTGAVLASIGPVTSDAIRACGHDPAIEATEYTIDGLVNAIVDMYAEK